MMTCVQRRGWCPSLFASTKRPPTVGKSTEPYPLLLPSSLSSSPSIPKGESISLSTSSVSSSSLSYGKRTKASTSSDKANDYYTSKRIDELHDRMDDIQLANFLTFVNHHLSSTGNGSKASVNDLIKDLANGHVLIDLIEVLAATKLKRERGHTRFHSLTNVQIVLDYLKSRTQLVNISPQEIVAGNRKQILALLWIIMKTFDFAGFRIANRNCFSENTLLGFGQDRSVIIKWLNNILNHSLNTIQTYITDFYIQTWINGYYLSIIIKYLVPLSAKYLTMECFDHLKELDKSSSVEKERFRLCFIVSNYCFSTGTVVDDKDKSERSLFKYFTELQQTVSDILKANHVGKLIQNNPYAKQILDTVAATEHSSHVINNNEQYLACIKDDHHQSAPPTSCRDPRTSTAGGRQELACLRTVEKSRPVKAVPNGEQAQRGNRWEKTESPPRDAAIVNGDNGKSVPNEKPLQHAVEEKPTVDQALVAQQEVESHVPVAEQNNNSSSSKSSEEGVESIVPTDESQYDAPLEPAAVIVPEAEKIEHPTIDETSNSSPPSTEQVSEQIEQPTAVVEESPIADETPSASPAVQPETIEHPNATPVELEQPASTGDDKESTNAFQAVEQAAVVSEKVEQVDSGIDTSNTTEEELSSSIDAHLNDTLAEAMPIDEQNTSLTEFEPLEPAIDVQPAEVPAVREEVPVTMSVVPKPETNGHHVALVDDTNKASANAPTTNKKGKKRQQNAVNNNNTQEQRTNDGHSSETPPIHLPTQEKAVPITKVDLAPANNPEQPSVVNAWTSSVTPKTNGIATLAETHPSTVNRRSVDTPPAVVPKQPVSSNLETNRQIPSSRKSGNHSRKVPAEASSNKENQHFAVTHKPSTAPAKDVDQRKTAVEPTAPSKCAHDADIANAASLRTNNEFDQTAAGSKKKVATPLEQTKQTATVVEEVEQTPRSNGNKKSDAAQVSLDRQQLNTSPEQLAVSSTAHNDKKKPSPRNKRARRSHAKKANAPVPTEDAHETSTHSEEEHVESPPLPANLITTSHEPEPLANPSPSPRTPSPEKPSHNEYLSARVR